MFFNSKQFTEHYLPVPQASLEVPRERTHLPMQLTWVSPWVERISWGREMATTPAFLPGKSRGNGPRSLARVDDLVTTTWLGGGLALKG